MTTRAEDPSVRHFAADVLHNKLRAVCKEIEGVRAGDDVEHVHDMRVASRRLRNALTLFEDCFPPKQFSAWKKRTRRLTRALGAARDGDVQILFLAEFLTNLHEPAHRPGVGRLRLRLEQRRAKLQERVVRALDRFETEDTVADLEHALRELGMDNAGSFSDELYALAARHISKRTSALLQYEPFVARPECVAEHHAMRIAAKHLRYTLEVFAPLYSDELQMTLEAARDVQEQLGQIHDCDVWVDFLPVFIEAERVRTLDYAGRLDGFTEMVSGMQHVREDRARHRAELHTKFLSYWNSIDKRIKSPSLQKSTGAHGKSYRTRI
jgi:CHAD domain-containing protein